MVTNKSGRNYFQRYERMLVLLARIFSKTPEPIKKVIWNFFDGYEGKISVGVRYCLFSSAAGGCGKNVFIGRGVILKNIQNLTIGDNVSIHAGCYIDAYGGVFIGDNVSIAHQSSIVSFEHTWGEVGVPIKYNDIVCSGVHISSDVWIGCGVRVLDGVGIGNRVIVAAGAVVKDRLDSHSVYAGVPARKIRSV